MKKALSVVLVALIILLCTSCKGLKNDSSDSDEYFPATADSVSQIETEPSKIKTIETPNETTQTAHKGEKLELDFEFDSDKSIDEEDVKVIIQDESIIKIESIQIHNILDYIEVNITALKFGSTKLQVTSADGMVKSEEVTINVPTELESAEINGDTRLTLKIGDSASVSAKLKPSDLTESDVKIVADMDDKIEIKDAKFKTEGDYTLLTFSIVAKKVGSYIDVDICNANGDSFSSLEVTVEEKETVPPTTVAPKKTVESSKSEEAPPVNNYDDDDNDDNAGYSSTYILNTNTKKFHYPSCSSVNKMADKNKQEYTGTREEVIAMGYDPCKRCNP